MSTEQAGKFRKKPVVIEAMQVDFEGSNLPAIFAWLGEHRGPKAGPRKIFGNDAGEVIIRTLEGDMRVEPLDWIIRGVKGEFYPCKPDIFEATYEQVAE